MNTPRAFRAAFLCLLVSPLAAQIKVGGYVLSPNGWLAYTTTNPSNGVRFIPPQARLYGYNASDGLWHPCTTSYPCTVPGGTPPPGAPAGNATPVFVTVAPSSAPVVDLSSCAPGVKCLVSLTLSANAVGSVTGIQAGLDVVLSVCNAATAYTWTPPSALHGSMIVPIGPSTCNVQPFTSFNGTTLVALSGGVNEAP